MREIIFTSMMTGRNSEIVQANYLIRITSTHNLNKECNFPGGSSYFFVPYSTVAKIPALCFFSNSSKIEVICSFLHFSIAHRYTCSMYYVSQTSVCCGCNKNANFNISIINQQ